MRTSHGECICYLRIIHSRETKNRHRCPHQVEFVFAKLLIVGANVQLGGQGVLWVEAAHAHVQLDLAHRDAHAIGACKPESTTFRQGIMPL